MELTNLRPSARRLALVAIVAIAVSAMSRELVEWLPSSTMIDEPWFVKPAVRAVMRPDSNPGWFGHPAATFIFPLAAVYGVVWGNGAFETLRNHGAPLFLTARVVSIAFAALGLVFVYLLGRLVAGDLTGLVAAAMISASAETMSLCGIARSDGASLLFGSVALLQCFRIIKSPSKGGFAIAGAALGAAIATKYYFAIFCATPCIAATIELRRRWRSGEPLAPVAHMLVLAALMTVLVFLVLVPHLFFTWDVFVRQLSDELRVHPLSSGGSWWNTLRWYVRSGVPSLFSLPIAVLMIVGASVAFLRRRTPVIVAAAVAFLFLAGVSVLKQTWSRWLIAIAPLLAVVGAYGLVVLGTVIAERWRRARRWAEIAVVVLGGVALMGPPTLAIARAEHPNAATALRQWIADEASPRSSFAMDLDGGEWLGVLIPKKEHVLPRGIRVYREFQNLADAGHSVASLRCSGFDHLVLDWPHALANENDAFYRRVAESGRFIRSFRSGESEYRVFTIADVRCQRSEK